MTATTRLLSLAVGFAVVCAGVSMASPQRPYRVSDQQLEDLVNRLDTHRDAFHVSFERAMARGPVNGSPTEDEIWRSVTSLDQAVDLLRDRVIDQHSVTADAADVLQRASSIDHFMARNRLEPTVHSDWQALREDMNNLARAYGIPWNWDGAAFHRLTGTYQLDSDGSDDPRQAAELAARAAPPEVRRRTYQNLLARLQAPDVIAIERTDNSVTMASTRGRRVTFAADGREHVERWSAERTMHTRATLEGERLEVVTTGSRASEFTVTFDPTQDGRSLRMTRTIDDETLRHGVTVRSAYRRVSDEARWTVEAAGQRGRGDNAGFTTGEFVVPDGTRFVAVLDNALSTTTAREGDPYSMTARSPARYEGAVIHGVVTNVNESGRLTGRAGISLSLQSIRLRNGRSYRFDGVIDGVRIPDGESVRVDRQGTVGTDGSQAEKTLERGAIGAALGSIIGAIAGGGKGAAIGAVIGAGGGAGTVIVEGRDRLDLRRGTEVTITSGDPANPTFQGVQR